MEGTQRQTLRFATEFRKNIEMKLFDDLIEAIETDDPGKRMSPEAIVTWLKRQKAIVLTEYQ